jgi:hypothetical protein
MGGGGPAPCTGPGTAGRPAGGPASPGRGPGMGSGRCTRRRCLGWAAAGAAVAAAGCGPARPAHPTAAGAPLVLTAALDIPAALPLGTVAERTEL